MNASLKTITLHGSQQSKATGWQVLPGFATAELTNGRSIWCGDVSIDAALSRLKRDGIDCSEYEARLADVCKPFGPSEKEKAATHYQSGYGKAVPEHLGEWGFSTTFGRWGRVVTFAGGDPIFTYPVLDSSN